MNMVKDILIKYGLYEKADREFKNATKGDIGRIDFSKRYTIYEKHLINRISEINKLISEERCEKFIRCESSIYHTDINCQKCDLYNNKIKKLEEEIEELSNALTENNDNLKELLKNL